MSKDPKAQTNFFAQAAKSKQNGGSGIEAAAAAAAALGAALKARHQDQRSRFGFGRLPLSGCEVLLVFGFLGVYPAPFIANTAECVGFFVVRRPVHNNLPTFF